MHCSASCRKKGYALVEVEEVVTPHKTRLNSPLKRSPSVSATSVATLTSFDSFAGLESGDRLQEVESMGYAKTGSEDELSRHSEQMQCEPCKGRLSFRSGKTRLLVLFLVALCIWRSRGQWLGLCRGKRKQKAVWTAIAFFVSSLGSHPKMAEHVQSAILGMNWQIRPLEDHGWWTLAEYSKSRLWQCVWTAVWIDFLSSELLAGGKELSFCMQFLRA